MDWTASVDGYCERLSPDFWAEPLNAVTNAAFLIAAIVAYRLLQQQGTRDRYCGLLIAIVAAIGIGSFLFHTLATRWAALADVAPIAVFILVYFYGAMRRFVGLARLVSLAATIAFFILSAAVAPLTQPIFGSSSGYLPALLAIAAVSVFLHGKGHPAWRDLAIGAAVFAISIALRMTDLPLCSALPFGTHFLWHCLNATLLYILVRAMIIHRPAG